MEFEIVPAYEISFAEQARVANEAFAGYVGGWHDLDAAALARFAVLQGSDMFYSRLVRSGDALLGFGYISRTGNVLRLCGMGIVPSARGTGAAGHLLAHLLGEARQRQDAAMILEVIQQNPRAVALYRRHRFREMGNLLGWRRKAEKSGGGAEIQEIPTLEALRLPMAREFPDIPWQISRHAVAKAERTRAFRSDKACLVIGDPEIEPLRIYGCFAPSEDWESIRELLRAVLNRFVDKEFFAPAIWPEDYGREVFEPLGFAREPISQFLMRLDL